MDGTKDELESMSREAEALRLQLLRVQGGQTELTQLWKSVQEQQQQQPPAPRETRRLAAAVSINEYLKGQKSSLQLGELKRNDPLSLFKAISRAAFGNEENAVALQSLAVRHGRLQAPLGGEKKQQKLSVTMNEVEGGRIPAPKEMIPLVVKFLRVEVRLVWSDRRISEQAAAQVSAIQYKVPPELGVAETVVYIAGSAGDECEISADLGSGSQPLHVRLKYMNSAYNTLQLTEEVMRPQTNPGAASSYYSEYERPPGWTDHSSQAGEVQDHRIVRIGDAQFTIAELEAGVPLGDNRSKYWVQNDTDGMPRVFLEDLRRCEPTLSRGCTQLWSGRSQARTLSTPPTLHLSFK